MAGTYQEERPSRDRERSPIQRSYDRTSDPETVGARIFIQNLTPELTKDMIRDHFIRWGKVVCVSLSKNNFGFVQFENDYEAQACLAAGYSTVVNGVKINVKQAKLQGPSEAPPSTPGSIGMNFVAASDNGGKRWNLRGGYGPSRDHAQFLPPPPAREESYYNDPYYRGGGNAHDEERLRYQEYYGANYDRPAQLEGVRGSIYNRSVLDPSPSAPTYQGSGYSSYPGQAPNTFYPIRPNDMGMVGPNNQQSIYYRGEMGPLPSALSYENSAYPAEEEEEDPYPFGIVFPDNEQRERDRSPIQECYNRTSDPETVGARIFIQNLTPELTRDMIQDHFMIWGTVVCVSISKTFGFVQFEHDYEAQACVGSGYSTLINGVKIRVKQAKLQPQLEAGYVLKKSASNDDESSDRAGSPIQKSFDRTSDPETVGSRIFIQNLTPELTREMIQAHFMRWGTVVCVSLSKNNFGFVQYGHDSEAQSCLLSGYSTVVNGVKINVKQAKLQTQSEGPPSTPGSVGMNSNENGNKRWNARGGYDRNRDHVQFIPASQPTEHSFYNDAYYRGNGNAHDEERLRHQEYYREYYDQQSELIS